MSPETEELLRQEILRTAEQSLPQAVTLPILHTMLRPVFHGLTIDTLEPHVNFLVEKGFLNPAPKALSSNKAWNLTAAGRYLLAEQGLA